jgi:hypothetical protein
LPTLRGLSPLLTADPPARRATRAADRDAHRTCFAPLGQLNREHPVGTLGGHVLGVDLRRQREAPGEPAVLALDDEVASFLFAFFPLEALLTRDGQDAVLDRDVDVVAACRGPRPDP